jgi:hypothetical protein
MREASSELCRLRLPCLVPESFLGGYVMAVDSVVAEELAGSGDALRSKEHFRWVMAVNSAVVGEREESADAHCCMQRM